MIKQLSNSVKYIGVDDLDLDLLKASTSSRKASHTILT